MSDENTEINPTTEVVDDGAAAGAESTVSEETSTDGGQAAGDGVEAGAEGQDGQDEGEHTEGTTTEGGEGEGAEAHQPNMVFKAGFYNKETRQLEQKEHSIDDRFKPLMASPEGEKLVRELHEKAEGLESVKERYNEQKVQNQTVAAENSELKGGINKVRTIYQTAVKTQNWHKLDDFFRLLDIPQENILKYALEKVRLSEMDPTQRHAVESQLESDRRTEQLQQERDMAHHQLQSTSQQAKAQQVDFVIGKPEVTALAAEFDKRAGKQGAFRDAVFYEGSKAWNVDKQDLPAADAVERVIKTYGLAGVNTGAATQTPNLTSPGNGAAAPRVVKRSTQTIPNVGSRSASPLPSKPKTMDDLLKYRKETHGF